MERPDTSSDCALMLRARCNDVDAFERLYERHHARLQHFFHALCARSRGAGPSQTAEDLCHETFLRIWRLRMRYQATGTFAAYLFGVARNVWREHCRHAVRPGRFPEPLDDGGALKALGTPPDEAAARAELGDDILAALDQLPEEQRMVFVLRQVEGLGLEEIARILNCPVNTVRSRKLLAIKKLRTLLRGSMVI